MKKTAEILVVAFAVVAGGCSTSEFIPAEPPADRLRPVTAKVESPFYASDHEVVFAIGPDLELMSVLSVDERVRWVSAAPAQGIRVQRAVAQPANSPDEDASQSVSVQTESLRLAIADGVLSSPARLALARFRPDESDRLFATVLLENAGDMDTLLSMTEIWNGVAAGLKARGVPGDNITFGGVVKSPSGKNEILIIRVTP